MRTDSGSARPSSSASSRQASKPSDSSACRRTRGIKAFTAASSKSAMRAMVGAPWSSVVARQNCVLIKVPETLWNGPSLSMPA